MPSKSGCPRFAFLARILAVLLLSWSLTGCTTVQEPTYNSIYDYPISAAAKKQEKKRLFGAWGRSEEPSVPQSMRDFMGLEPIRP